VQEIIGHTALDGVESLTDITEPVRILLLNGDMADDFGLESSVIADFQGSGPRLGQEAQPDDVPLARSFHDADLEYFHMAPKAGKCRINTWRFTWREAPAGANGQGEPDTHR
jgi:hypothetical protein